ncbi:hypothetical protein IMCC3135_31350 [Granulosicoccus antarcticus IMCC3135]|uniref:Uncharacterized protein n=1 Tax=Granulosicoccus antarcticus IMCC3135 TaxID=1192854 RepID=A0A2Z2P228_9GAMM|nr:hypothetical protein IMCC3135_31350 [Granulosicoccus antarcticus IMCC3135]
MIVNQCLHTAERLELFCLARLPITSTDALNTRQLIRVCLEFDGRQRTATVSSVQRLIQGHCQNERLTAKGTLL